MRTIAAAKFKATCLSILDEVQEKREVVTVTKNGRPVARLVPLPLDPDQDPIFGFYRGKLEIVGDLIAPVYSDEEYEQFYKNSAAQAK